MEIVFEETARTASANQGLGCLWAGALIPAVVGGVTGTLMMTGQSMTPSLAAAVAYVVPICGVCVVVFGALAIEFGRRSKRTLTLTRGDAGLRLTIGSDATIEGPFELRYGWDRIPGGSGLKILVCDVMRGPELLVRLSLEIGAVHGTPKHWPRGIPVTNAPAIHGGYAVARLPELVKAMGG
ncbi:MAG: hypothetical protein AB7S26_24200 [Sandaracinaceae bacterium]